MSALIHVLTEHTRAVFHTNPLIDRRSFGAVSMTTARAWHLTCSQGSRSPPIAMNFYLSLLIWLILNLNHRYNQSCSPLCVRERVRRSGPLLSRSWFISAHLHTFRFSIKMQLSHHLIAFHISVIIITIVGLNVVLFLFNRVMLLY